MFGIKGGAAGGGYTQVVPMEDMNLHFTGDIHAIGAANNLLAAMLEAHLLHGNVLDIDPLSISWRRCMDINDRSLRDIVVGLGGKANGYPRQTGFDITAASEVMAIVAVASDLRDLRSAARRDHGRQHLRRRAGHRRAAAGRRLDGGAAQGDDQAEPRADARGPARVRALRPVREHRARQQLRRRRPRRAQARRLRRHRERLRLRHGHGEVLRHRLPPRQPAGRTRSCSSRRSRRSSTTPAIRTAGWTRSRRAPRTWSRHLGIIREFGLNAVVAVNAFPGDATEEVELVKRIALEHGAYAAEVNDGFLRGGEGGAALAEAVVAAADEPSKFDFVYPLDAPIEDKIEAIAKRVYGADGISLLPAARAKIKAFNNAGLDKLPICMAKTHLSLSHDPLLANAPTGFTVGVRDLRAYTGAGWIVALCGDMQTMPGLGKTPAAINVDIDDRGETVGLF